MKETDLYEPIKKYLEKQGYSVNSEVRGCDITARKNDELIIIELKTGMSLALIYQLIKRKEMADSVYAAVPVKPGQREIPGYGDVLRLLRRLGSGLILVRFLKSKTRVEVVLHPGDHEPKKRHKARAAIIREIDGRYAEFNAGGSASTDTFISAYRQEALLIAWLLLHSGPLSPSELLKKGTGRKTQTILSKNVYGWFNKIDRGIYGLSEEGAAALDSYSRPLDKIIGVYREKHSPG